MNFLSLLSAIPGIGKHKTVIGSVATLATVFAPKVMPQLDAISQGENAAGIMLGVGLVHKLWKSRK